MDSYTEEKLHRIAIASYSEATEARARDSIWEIPFIEKVDNAEV